MKLIPESIEHPIYITIRYIVMMISLTLVLWMNASHFDETELKVIISMFFLGASGEGIISLVKSKIT